MNKYVLLAIAMLAVAVPALAGEQNFVTVPEPATLALLASGIGGVAVLRRIVKR